MIINKIERAGTHPPFANGNILWVSLKIGSVTFAKAVVMMFCRLPIMRVRRILPRTIHMRNDNV
jgi:hypothetical protein